MSTEKKEVEISRGLTKRSLAIGLVLIIAMTVYENVWNWTYAWNDRLQNFTPTMEGVLASPWYMFWSWALWIFFLPLLLFAFLPKRLRLTPQELAVIFAMILVTYPLAQRQGHLRNPASGALSTPKGWTADEPFRYIWKFMAPWHANTIPLTPDGRVDTKLIDAYWNARPRSRVPGPLGWPIEWGYFMPSIVFGFFEIIFTLFMAVFLAAILRKQYVEIEALPFPNATAATTLINEATTTPEGGSGWFATKPKLLSNKWLWIGALLAQVFMIPVWLGLLLPYAGVAATPYEVYTDVARNVIIPYMPIAVVYTIPWALGFGLLMPLEVLISWFITWIVFIVILTNVQWMAGIFTPPPTTASMDWYNSRAISYYFLRVDPAGQGLRAWSFGILLAAAFYPMWVHRRHVIATIKAMWKPQPELERGDIPIKWYWIGFIVSFIGYLALFSITAAAPYLWMTALSMILLMIAWVGVSRVRAETGWYGGFGPGGTLLGYRYPNHWWNRVALKNLIGESKPEGAATGANAVYFWTFQSCHSTFQNEYAPIGMPMPTMLEAFKVGYDTKTVARDLLVGVIIALIVAYWVCNTMVVWMFHTFNWYQGPGQARMVLHDWWTSGHASRGAPEGWRGYWYMGYGDPTGPDIPNTVTQYVIGAVVGVVLLWLRARFPAFIYNPLTIPMWGLVGRCSDVFVMFLLALIIKYLVVRTYGVIQYERKLIPLAIGLIIGGILLFVTDDILYFAFRRRFYV